MKTCYNCGSSYSGNFCPECGESTPHRINHHFVWHEVQHGVLHFENGLFYTIKELITHPGDCVRHFLEGNRKRNYKPIAFVIVTSAIYLLVKHFLHFNEFGNAQMPGKNPKILMNWVAENYSYANLIEILLIAIVLKLFFINREYNYFEYLVLLCYLTGMGMLFGVIAMIAAHYTGAGFIYHSIYFWAFFVYVSWGIGQFFGGGRINYLLGGISYFCGVSAFSVFAIGIGIAMDLMGL
ncbi:MAG TPA: DUF3667 domain-containing protein [Flavobacterium sp.]|jgi:hypothetical protein